MSDNQLTAAEAIRNMQKSANEWWKPVSDAAKQLYESVLVPCKCCGKTPVVSDVGGYNAYCEISCKCEKGVVVGSPDRAEAITCWNILNGRKGEK